MVENSLGRLWLTGHPNADLRSEWKYYLDEAEQESEVQAQLETIRKEYADLKPEEIRCIDPCMGSGHILCYMFDVLVKIYEDYGYTAREAVQNILRKNLYGLDIDERAAQLAYFAVMMKARQYDRRFFAQKDENGEPDIPQPNVYATASFPEGREYGSLLMAEDPGEMFGGTAQLSFYDSEWTVKKLLSQKYDVVCTNPPYMGGSGMNEKLAEFVKKNFPDSKSDLSTCFMERCENFCKETGYYSMINIPVWMFLSSYEKLREKILANNTYINMVHFGRGVFGSDFGTTAFVISKKKYNGYTGVYRRLFEKQGAVDSVEQKEKWFFEGRGYHIAKQENFSKIPGAPVAYWVSENFVRAFERGISVDSISDFTGSQHITADNERFLRFFWEVNNNKVGKNNNWAFYAKGGDFRKWYGNIQLVLSTTTSAMSYYKTNQTSNCLAEKYWFTEGITYSAITSKGTGFRYYAPIGYWSI